MVPADSDRISRVPPYSGGPPDALCLPVPDFHRLRSDFPDCSSSENAFLWELLLPRHCRNNDGLGSSPFDRHYSGNRCFFLFLGVLRCFSSPRSPSLAGVHGLQPWGLPHSDISGSIPVCGSPELFAAYHVLLRLQKPRHPPFALVTFNFLRKLQLTAAPTPALRAPPFRGTPPAAGAARL